MNYNYSGKTDIGPERKVNQDNYGTIKNDWGSIFIVSDGFGHERGGVYASQTTVNKFIEQFSIESPVEIKRFLVDTFNLINRDIYYHKVSKFEKAMMGCTAVVMLLHNNVVHIAHIGDSRAYLIRNGEITQLTKDHSYIQSLIDKGKVTPDKAKLHPKRHVLSRALGSHRKTLPSYLKLEIAKNDKIILCTDGVWGFIDSEKLLEKANMNSTMEAVDDIIQTVKDNFGSDNITLQIIEFIK